MLGLHVKIRTQRDATSRGSWNRKTLTTNKAPFQLFFVGQEDSNAIVSANDIMGMAKESGNYGAFYEIDFTSIDPEEDSKRRGHKVISSLDGAIQMFRSTILRQIQISSDNLAGSENTGGSKVFILISNPRAVEAMEHNPSEYRVFVNRMKHAMNPGGQLGITMLVTSPESVIEPMLGLSHDDETLDYAAEIEFGDES